MTRLALAVLLAACGDASADDPERLTVLAASSLTDAIGAIEAGFEEASPGAEVSASFAGSQVLRLQIEQGAPADVFVSADEAHMDVLVSAGLVVERALLAHNELVIIVPLDNPAAIESFADLPRARRVVIGDANVPVGRYTRAMLSRAAERFGAELESEVLAHVVSEESNVRLVRTKVELGEADAAVVYRSDAASSDRVRVIAVPADVNVRADYHIGVVAASARPLLARRFVEHALGDRGQRVLSAHGFVPRR